MNQFGAVPGEKKYDIQLTKTEYKLWLRLKSITKPSEVHLTTDEKGRVRSVKVFEVKEEVLLVD